MNSRTPNTILACQFLLGNGAASRSYSPDFIVSQLAKLPAWSADERSNPLGYMFFRLLPSLVGRRRRIHGRYWSFSLTNGSEFRSMLFRLFATEQGGAHLGNTFGRLLAPSVRLGHKPSGFRRRAESRRSLPASSGVSESASLGFVEADPIAFCALPVPCTLSDNGKYRDQGQPKKLAYPVVFVRPSTKILVSRPTDVRIQSSRGPIGPSNIPNRAIARIRKGVNEPRPGIAFHTLIIDVIALCGYEGEYEIPETWETYRWKAVGGYGSQGDGRGRANANRECIWFSPYCLRPDRSLFA